MTMRDPLRYFKMSNREIASELDRLGREFDQTRDGEGHGGSPGEGLVEEMGALETEQARRVFHKAGAVVELVCPVPAGSRLGAAREHIPAGSKGTIVEVYPGGEAFEIRFGKKVVTVARIEFTPH